MLTTLYLAILGRAPDAAGLAYWTNQWEQGMSLRQITLSLMQSEEVQARYPSTLAGEAFVTQLYFNLFDRGPDTNGLNYWLSQLEEGAVVRESMVLTLLNAAFAGDGEDAALLRARTEAAERYLAEQESGNRSFDLREAEITLLQIRRHLLAEEEAGNDEEPNGLGWLFDRWPTDPPEPEPELHEIVIFGSVSSTGVMSTVDDNLSSYHQFDGMQAGSTYRAEAHRLENDFDPAMWVFEGLLSADDFVVAHFDFADSRLLGVGDDEIPFPDGPHGDPRVEFVAPESGQFTVVVTNFASGPDDGGDGRFDYRLEVVEIA